MRACSRPFCGGGRFLPDSGREKRPAAMSFTARGVRQSHAPAENGLEGQPSGRPSAAGSWKHKAYALLLASACRLGCDAHKKTLSRLWEPHPPRAAHELESPRAHDGCASLGSGRAAENNGLFRTHAGRKSKARRGETVHDFPRYSPNPHPMLETGFLHAFAGAIRQNAHVIQSRQRIVRSCTHPKRNCLY